MLARPPLFSSRNKQLYCSFSMFVCLSVDLVKMCHDLRTTREPGEREEHAEESPEAEDREDAPHREAHVRLVAAALSSKFTAVNLGGNCGGGSVEAPRTVSRHVVKHIVGRNRSLSWRTHSRRRARAPKCANQSLTAHAVFYHVQGMSPAVHRSGKKSLTFHSIFFFFLILFFFLKKKKKRSHKHHIPARCHASVVFK